MPPVAPKEQRGLARRVGPDLLLRVASAVVLAPLAIGAAYVGGWLFAGFWLIAALGVLWEWSTLVGGNAAQRITLAGGAALIVATLALQLGHPALALAAVVAGMAAVAVAPRSRLSASGGVSYAAAIVLSPVLLRADSHYGFAVVMLLFAVVWGTDIAAYFGGRLIGGPKLLARVSPKKTWSGALVGAAAAVLLGLAVAKVAAIGNVAAIALLCLLLSAASQAGDLFESAIKRRFGAKDTSQLIPGHGGLMDRLDGFVVAALIAALIGAARGGLTTPSRGLLIW